MSGFPLVETLFRRSATEKEKGKKVYLEIMELQSQFVTKLSRVDLDKEGVL